MSNKISQRLARINTWLNKLTQEKYILYRSWRDSDEGRDWKAKQHQKQAGKCNQCQLVLPIQNLTIDHIQPISKGGHPTDTANLQLLCHPCNQAKSNKIT